MEETSANNVKIDPEVSDTKKAIDTSSPATHMGDTGDIQVNVKIECDYADINDQESGLTDNSKDVPQSVNVMDDVIDIKEEPIEPPPSPIKNEKKTIVIPINTKHERDNDTDCNEEFPSPVLLQQDSLPHVENEIKQSCRRCAICSIKFKSKPAMLKHVKLHTAPEKFECNECQKQLATKSGLKRHIQDVHTECHRHRCDVCGDRFQNSDLALAHMKTHTDYKCNKCDESFSNVTELEQHKATSHITKKPYKCKLCAKRYSKNACLQKHVIKTHSEKTAKSHKCTVCNKEFYKAHKLIIHSRIHTGEKPYKCTVCNKAFSRLDTLLNSHMPTHTGEKPHECDVCQRKFVTSTRLAYHKRVHSGVKPYECKLCKKRFRVSAQVGKHLRSRHRRNLEFKCDVCDESFSFEKRLKSHIKKQHG